uniref:AbrB/MazE/SpoVT family DNA-binding domain-containing protein n=1 Tax=Mesocestoides corti TaxID=53468 RepID=A0A5K3F0R8_MESCO
MDIKDTAVSRPSSTNIMGKSLVKSALLNELNQDKSIKVTHRYANSPTLRVFTKNGETEYLSQ